MRVAGARALAAMRAGHVRTMRFLNNLKLIVKIAIPTVVFVAIAIGLVSVAKTGLDALSADTKELTDVETARLIRILQINAEVNEASIQEKNLILFSSVEADRLQSAEGVYQQYKKLALQHMDELAALSGTQERRAVNDNIKATLVAYFSQMDKSVAHASEGRRFLRAPDFQRRGSRPAPEDPRSPDRTHRRQPEGSRPCGPGSGSPGVRHFDLS